jgi:hypothetical protein
MLLQEPKTQDEAFRAGLRGAPYCDVDLYEVVMAVPEAGTLDAPKRPTIFVIVDLIGENQTKWLRTTYWAYAKDLVHDECYKIGRVLRYILWYFDLVGVDEKRGTLLGIALMQAGLQQIEKHNAKRVADGYDSTKFVTHFRRMLDNKVVPLPPGRSAVEIEKEMLAYAKRKSAITPLGPNSFSAN